MSNLQNRLCLLNGLDAAAVAEEVGLESVAAVIQEMCFGSKADVALTAAIAIGDTALIDRASEAVLFGDYSRAMLVVAARHNKNPTFAQIRDEVLGSLGSSV